MEKVVLTILSLMLVPGLSWAGKDSSDSWDNLKQLRAGEKIEVIDMNLKSFRGIFVSVSDQAISLQSKTGSFSVERPNVFRVSVGDTSKRKRNMLLGAAIGAGAGLALSLVANAPGSNEGNDNPALIAGLTAGSAGAGLGLGVASGARTVYRAQKAKGGGAPLL